MTATIAISVFFGFVAAAAMISCHASIRLGVTRWKEIRAELAAIARGPVEAKVPLRRPKEAFVLLAA